MRSARRFLPMAIAAALVLASGSASAARLDYTLDAGVEDNDNVALTTTDRIERRFLRAGFGFLFSQDSSAIQADIEGRADYRDYRDDRLSNDLEGDLAARVNWVAIPERLHFTVQDDLSVQSVNTLVADSPNNRQQVNVISAGPTLFFRIGGTFRGQAELRFIDSRADVTDEFNSRRTAAAVRAIKDIDTTSLVSFNLQGQRVDFDGGAAVRDYDRYEGYVRYARTLSDFDLGIEGGYTRQRYEDGQTLWWPLVRGNVRWRASPRSWFTITGANMISDAASDALNGIVPGSELPDSVVTGNAQITSAAYRLRRFDLTYAYTGTLLSASIGPLVENREFIDGGELDQSIRGVRGNLGWRLRPTVELDAFASQENTDYRTIDRVDKTRYFGAGLEKRWTRHWSTRLQWARYERSSPVTAQDVRQNSLWLSVAYRNR